MILAKTATPSEPRPASRFAGAAIKPVGVSPWAKRPRPGLHWRPDAVPSQAREVARLQTVAAERRLLVGALFSL